MTVLSRRKMQREKSLVALVATSSKKEKKKIKNFEKLKYI
jgi:hypothetical protein